MSDAAENACTQTPPPCHPERRAPHPVILSEVRRQPSGVEGPRGCWRRLRPVETFPPRLTLVRLVRKPSSTIPSTGGSRHEAQDGGSLLEMFSRFMSAYAEMGPSTPLGCRLATLRMTR